MSRTDVATALTALKTHREAMSGVSIVSLFDADKDRFGALHATLDDLTFDYSKQRLDARALALLFDLARAADFEARRAALFAGEPVNLTEGRAAMHMALRADGRAPMLAQGRDVMPEVLAVRAKVAAFAEAVRSGAIRGARGDVFTDIVNIGIGGSDLGPAMAARALAPFAKPGLATHFVSNVDGADIGDTLRGLDLAKTLFIVSSKTFTTQETMTNAQTARAAVAAALGEAAVADHFAAVSTKLDLVAKFGIREDRVFGFWDWVGGRYSLWSSIGLALVIAIGAEGFAEFLRGGADVDAHFRDTPIERNIPALMGLIGVWNHNVWGSETQAVIPYDQRLGRFPAYLQQLEMESNGKSVTREGAPAPMDTAPVIWGEAGTNGQHAFFQMLHQGTQIVPVDFVVAAEPTHADAHHHALLVANCLAQSQSLMLGRTRAQAEALLEGQGLAPPAVQALAPHKVFPGDRPSSTLMHRTLTPRALGRLVALYEHKVFTQSVIWDINAFDQWGVELGKEMSNDLAPIVEDAHAPLDRLNGSTAGLIATRRRLMGAG